MTESFGELKGETFTQNRRGQYVPAIPLPFYGGIASMAILRRYMCVECGKGFRTEKAYREHYALEHILDLD